MRCYDTILRKFWHKSLFSRIQQTLSIQDVQESVTMNNAYALYLNSLSFKAIDPTLLFSMLGLHVNLLLQEFSMFVFSFLENFNLQAKITMSSSSFKGQSYHRCTFNFFFFIFEFSSFDLLIIILFIKNHLINYFQVDKLSIEEDC